ncbi:FAD-dependent oxidoreductase [Bosea sp. SSUT16]|uniref:FAD-dependent oxidoreductase n=1 Tax=Bosea spartocytisi TaxID=2773451 RepID=A0A927E9R2_9HYPH|nr:FAD-dependent oxidoreductase [Bosea spartocytisi]MBD3846495.1 FAD-dependent oxidoreductase [Bosea spartocytisi]MCT4472041.1 FAD-dependent oxidoreductase [Bosea spartocytisi]
MSNRPEEHCDLLVIGSGAGGLSAAVVAAWHGLKVVVVEKEPVFGGTTAWSGGWMWVPRNPLAREAGIEEDGEAVRTYLRHELGNHYDEARIEAFLAAAPEMVSFFRANTAVQFIDGNKIPDMHGNAPGAGLGGRSVCAAPFDGRALGPLVAKLRPPLPEISLLGMGIASGADFAHFLNATRSWTSFRHVARRIGRHALDLVRHGRGMQLVNGNALVARLLKSASDLGVDLHAKAPARRLLSHDGAVIGAVVDRDGQEHRIIARAGVVLACGGFPHDYERLKELVPRNPTGRAHWSAAPRSNTGDGLRLGESVGALVDGGLAAPCAWAPVSLVPRRDGSFGHFPHLVERAKPGLIAVTVDGRRFVNEADSYYDYVEALLKAIPAGAEPVSWLICDHRFQRRYGLGFAKPAPLPLAPYLASSYLRRGKTLAELARICGIDPDRLVETVARYNAAAAQGRDPQFHRGETPYNRAGGDASVRPNPSVAPIEHGPFYAVKIVPGSLGTFAGLKTDAQANVLDTQGRPIAGLFAVGADMASVMGGTYPAGGINLGPAMTFGYLVGRNAAHHPHSSATGHPP